MPVKLNRITVDAPLHEVAFIRRRSHGFSTLELLVVIAIIGILAAIAAINLRPLAHDASNVASQLSSGMKQARARAMSTTSAYRVVYVSNQDFRVEYANGCSSPAWTADARYDLSFESNVTVDAPGYDFGDALVCYNSRGLADTNVILEVDDDRGRRRTVEVFLGGAVEIR